MYRVIIVEDEMLMRIGIKGSVDWAKFDMEVVADFADGVAAWEYYQQHAPDVVITDLRMPRMDGMQLIANIRGQDKLTRIVVLSCLEEFALAQKAVALGVSNYILKLTMTEEELESVLGGLVEELSQQEHRLSHSTHAQLPSIGIDLMKEKVLKDFLFYGIFSAKEFERFAEQSGMRFSPVRMVVCMMELDRYSDFKAKFKDKHGHLIKMSMLNILNEITSEGRRGEALFIDDARYLLLFHYPDLHSEQAIMQETRAVLNRIGETIRSCYNGSASFGISDMRSGYDELPKLYSQAQRMLELKFLSGPGLLHAGEPIADTTAVKRKLAAIRQFEPFRKLLTPAKLRELDQYIDSFDQGLSEGSKALEILMFQFVQWIATQMYNNNQQEKTLLINITDSIERCDSLPDMLDQVASYLADLTEQVRNELMLSREIQQAIQYIKQHYAESIHLQLVAEKVNLSAGYLSYLFKKEFDINFIDYVNHYRVERAKELLSTTQMKSSDIAVQVGFSPEYTYFSKVFKKVTGLTPNEYRNQLVTSSEARERR